VRKPDATDDLLAKAPGRDPDPLLAHWQYGLGRVAVWTPGLGKDWAGNWATGQAAVWDDTLHWLLRGVASTSLEPQLVQGSTHAGGQPSPEGGQSVEPTAPWLVSVDTLQNTGITLDLLQLHGTAITPGGGIGRLTFSQVAPGQYDAPLPSGGPGVYRLSVYQGDGSGAVSALVAAPYSSAYAPRRPDHALLTELAAGSGGRVLAGAGDIRRQGVRTATVRDLWWLAAVLALALFVCEIAVRQSGWRQRRIGI
jgi:hypothetical protein